MPADYRQYPFAKGHRPHGWAETTVGEVLLEIQSGFSSGKHNQTGQGIPHLRPMSVSPLGEITLEGVRYIAPEAGNSRLAEGDVLFTNTSSTVWVGKTAVVRQPGDWAFSNHMTRLRVGTGMDPEFVARQLHYLCMCGYFAFHCKKHINQSSIAGGQLAEDVPFRCPPAKEQSRITSKLTRLLKRERNVRKALETLRALIQEYRAAVLEAACTGRLVPTEAELARKERREYEPASALLERILHERRTKWEADQLAKMRAAGKEPRDDKWKDRYEEPVGSQTKLTLPEGWTTASINALIDEPLCNGVSIAGSDRPPGVRALRLSAMSDHGFDYQDVRYLPLTQNSISDLWVRKRDFFISRGNGSLSLVGRGTVAQKPPYKVIFPDTMIRLRICSIEQAVGWVPGIWTSTLVRRQIVARAKTTAGIWKVSQPSVESIALPLPPLEEQKRIVAELKRRFASLTRIENEVLGAIDQTTGLRASFFRRAIAGKLVEQSEGEDSAELLISAIAVQRTQLAEKRKREGRKKMKKKIERVNERRDLVEILAEHPEGLTPERLLLAAGYSADEVPSFYQQLRKAEGMIEETRPARKVVLLKRRKP